MASFAAHGESLLEPERISSRQSLFEGFDLWEDSKGSTHAPASPGDFDLGEQLLLMPQSVYEPLSFRLRERGTWTTNAALTEENALDDFYSHTEAGVGFVPKILDNTYAEVRAEYGIYRYAEHSALDFDSVEGGLGLIQLMPNLQNATGWLRYNHLRLLSGRGHDEIFTDHSIESGLYYPVPLGPRHSAFASFASEFSIDANPGYAQRHEHRLTLGHNLRPTDRLDISTYYQFSVLDYTEVERTDLLHVAGLALTAHLTKAVDLTLAGTYSMNDSDVTGGDYEVGDTGASISIKVNF